MLRSTAICLSQLPTAHAAGADAQASHPIAPIAVERIVERPIPSR